MARAMAMGNDKSWPLRASDHHVGVGRAWATFIPSFDSKNLVNGKKRWK
jgi:hypothetical protein